MSTNATSSGRPAKRHRDEIDEKIETLSKVINSMSGPNKHCLLAKLCNLKLKHQKLVVLSHSLPLSESSSQSLLTEFDMMITENEIDIEVESIRNSKKFKHTENKYLKKLSRESLNKETRVYISTPKEASTSSHNNYAENIKNSQGVERHSHNICRRTLLNDLHSVNIKCDKSTNTDPVLILNAKESTRPQSEITSFKKSMCTLEDMSPVRSLFLPGESLASLNISPTKENVSSTVDNKESLLEPGEYRYAISHNSEQGFIQSKWFENSFEMEHFVNENPDVSPQRLVIVENDSLPDENKPKTYYPSCNKSPENDEWPENFTEQILKADSITASLNKSGKATAKVANNATSQDITNAELPEPKVLPKTPMTFPKDPMILPDASTALPESKNSHRHIVNLFRSYKKIYSSEHVSRKWGLVNNSMLDQNDINNNENDKNLELTATDLRIASKNYQEKKNIKKSDITIHLNNKTSKGIGKDINNNRNSKDKQPNNSQRKSKSKPSSTKSKELSDKSKELSDKSKELSDKSKELSAKSKDVSAKSQDSCAKFGDLSTITQLPCKSEDSSTKQDSSSRKRGHRSTSKKQRSKENVSQMPSLNNILNDEKVVLHIKQIIKKAMERNGETPTTN